MLILLIVRDYLDLGFFREELVRKCCIFWFIAGLFCMRLALNYKYFVDYVTVIVPFTGRI